MPVENLLVVNVLPEDDPTAQAVIQSLKHSATEIQVIHAYERNFRPCVGCNACWLVTEDSKNKGKKGLCILSSKKKKPFLADPKFLQYRGFTVCDEADNGIQLWYLSFTENASLLKFKECAKHPHIDEQGYVLYYTSQCPFNAKYVPIVEKVAKENGVQFKAVHLQNKEEAQNAPTPITT